jgi:O-acetylserine/cysteine efflux transporter
MTAVAPRDLALLVLCTFLWGMNLIVSSIGLREFPPILFTTLRFAALAILLLPLLRSPKGQLGTLLLAALLSGAVPLGLMFAGLAGAENVSSVAIATQLSVPFTTLLSILLLGEVVRWRRWSGILLAFSGVMFMGFDAQVLGQWQSLMLVAASALAGAFGLMAVKKLSGFSPLELQAWMAVTGVVPLAILTWFVEQPSAALWQSVSWQGWAAVAYTTIMASLIAHTIFYYLVQRYPVTSVAPVTTLSPVFSVLFAVLLLGDELTTKIALGGAVTLVGVFIITMRERRIVDTGS